MESRLRRTLVAASAAAAALATACVATAWHDDAGVGTPRPEAQRPPRG